MSLNKLGELVPKMVDMLSMTPLDSPIDIPNHNIQSISPPRINDAANQLNDSQSNDYSLPLATAAEDGATAQNVDAPPGGSVLNAPSTEPAAAADNTTRPQNAAEDNRNESSSVAAAV